MVYLVSSGSLGHGLSYTAGVALADKIKKKKNNHIVLMSDGECNDFFNLGSCYVYNGKENKQYTCFC